MPWWPFKKSQPEEPVAETPTAVTYSIGEEETEKIPEFFEFAGGEYHYQILDIPTFYDVLTWERDTPGVFYIWNGNIQASYNGINDNAFNVTDLLEALDKKY